MDEKDKDHIRSEETWRFVLGRVAVVTVNEFIRAGGIIQIVIRLGEASGKLDSDPFKSFQRLKVNRAHDS